MTQSAPEKSIAVLPFENLSEEKANAYFADGIQEEILTRLAKIADLKVISRTSTQKYKSSPDNLREIAQQLGVANILEGSVQKAADQVRVNVQLVNAQTDSHLRSVELTGATGALPHAPTESVGRQNCQPNITVESTRTRQGESFLFRQIALSRQAIERRQHALQFTLGRKQVVIYLLCLIIRKTLDFFDQFVRAHELNLSPRGSLRKVRNASSSQS